MMPSSSTKLAAAIVAVLTGIDAHSIAAESINEVPNFVDSRSILDKGI